MWEDYICEYEIQFNKCKKGILFLIKKEEKNELLEIMEYHYRKMHVFGLNDFIEEEDRNYSYILELEELEKDKKLNILLKTFNLIK